MTVTVGYVILPHQEDFNFPPEVWWDYRRVVHFSGVLSGLQRWHAIVILVMALQVLLLDAVSGDGVTIQ